MGDYVFQDIDSVRDRDDRIKGPIAFTVDRRNRVNRFYKLKLDFRVLSFSEDDQYNSGPDTVQKYALRVKACMFARNPRNQFDYTRSNPLKFDLEYIDYVPRRSSTGGIEFERIVRQEFPFLNYGYAGGLIEHVLQEPDIEITGRGLDIPFFSTRVEMSVSIDRLDVARANRNFLTGEVMSQADCVFLEVSMVEKSSGREVFAAESNVVCDFFGANESLAGTGDNTEVPRLSRLNIFTRLRNKIRNRLFDKNY